MWWRYSDRYLARIGLDADQLARLRGSTLIERVARAQHASIPFENLDIHRGIPVRADAAVILDRLLTQGRGGICYELNGLLRVALVEFGLPAQFIGARVRKPDGALGPPDGHMAVVVALDAPRRYRLVDVGFGGEMVMATIDLDNPATLEIDLGASAYRLDNHVRDNLADFAEMAWFHSSSAQSRFTGSLIATLPARGGRVTLTARPGEGGLQFRLVTTDAEGVRAESALHLDEVPAVLAQQFGIALDDVPSALVVTH